MDTLVRNTTLRLSHRRAIGYEPLNRGDDSVPRTKRNDGRGIHSQRTFAKPRSVHKQQFSPYGTGDSFGERSISRPRSQKQQEVMNYSFSYKRNRAKQRQIYLQTYKLGSMDSSSGKLSGVRKLKKLVVKVKTVVVSVLSFMRADTLKSCSSGSVICATSPSRIAKIC